VLAQHRILDLRLEEPSIEEVVRKIYRDGAVSPPEARDVRE
jgi:hypothetical protein